MGCTACVPGQPAANSCSRHTHKLINQVVIVPSCTISAIKCADMLNRKDGSTTELAATTHNLQEVVRALIKEEEETPPNMLQLGSRTHNNKLRKYWRQYQYLQQQQWPSLCAHNTERLLLLLQCC